MMIWYKSGGALLIKVAFLKITVTNNLTEAIYICIYGMDTIIKDYFVSNFHFCGSNEQIYLSSYLIQNTKPGNAVIVLRNVAVATFVWYIVNAELVSTG